MDGFAFTASRKVTTSTIMWLSLSLSTFFFFSHCPVMQFIGYLRQKRHLQSTKNLHENKGQDDNTNSGNISLTLSSTRTPKLCRHPLPTNTSPSSRTPPTDRRSYNTFNNSPRGLSEAKHFPSSKPDGDCLSGNQSYLQKGRIQSCSKEWL
jgi:hypothetical protein